ncbi:MAG: 7-cyano-7-deazaguanine synthase [archaeon]
MKKCIVLFSGGLDSRLAVKIMQERGFEVFAVYFKLPFSKNSESEVENFSKKQKIKFDVFDCTKGKLLKEYLEVLKKTKYGRGAGFNPCVDCKIFMFRKAGEFAKKKEIIFLATGEVEGQRPMSQTARAMKIINRETGVQLIRPLTEIGISGRSRKKQIELAEKFKINYPSPAGGCLLCEKELKKRFEILVGKNLINEKTLPLVNIGRHFFIKNCWFVVGRNEEENEVIEESKGNFIESEKGKPAVYYSKKNRKSFAEELQKDYMKGGCREFKSERL